MVGLCGAVADVRSADALVDDLRWTGAERTFTTVDDRVAVGSVVHQFNAGLGYAETTDGDRIWLWGSVWGFDGPDGYETIPEGGASECATRYERHGIEFVERLNGNFVGAIHHADGDRVSLFTDRLGTRPLYYAVTDDGVVFSTNVQSLPLHPGVDADFDEEYLAEYFALQRTFGVRTPLTGVRKTQPGSVTTVDADGVVEADRYWRPVYTPLDRSREFFVDRLAETFRDVVADRTRRTADYGLLLSGGSDSRLVLAALASLDVPVHAFHLTDWHGHETRIAKRVASTADVPLSVLRRDRDYLARALESQPRIANFVGYFNQSHACGFADELSSTVDVVLNGHYGDTLFKGTKLRQPTVDLGSVGSFELPFERSITDLETYVDFRADVPTPSYVRQPESVRETYRSNVRTEGLSVVDHGVSYPSLREAMVAKSVPLTNINSQFFYYGTAQMMPSGTPFLDNRLIDLFLSTPVRFLLRGNLIDAATRRLAPDLADIPHGGGVVPIKYPFALQRAGELATGFAQRHLLPDPAEPHWTYGPWPDHSELIRSHEFVRETIDDNEELIRSLPFLSWDGVNECYDAHLDGEERMGPLYTLVTFLEMPVVDRVLEDREDRLADTVR